MPFHTDQAPYRFRQGTAPLLISMPHVGTHVPPALAARFTEEARRVPDTDWHLERLYDFADELGASVLIATHSRYVVDLNRPPDDQNLYPGQDTTGLCPVDTFDKTPIYAAGDVPDAAEIAERVEAVWRPYHAKLQDELARLKALHGAVGLWDAHSIRSVLPRFFEGKLPDFNLGTGNGASCAPRLAERLLGLARSDQRYTAVLNGRFKGGYITRHYGKPTLCVHAVQLEMAQVTYMEEAWPFGFSTERAGAVIDPLRMMIEAMLNHLDA